MARQLRGLPMRRAQRAKQRAALLERTPAWADMAAIQAFYEEAVRMTVAHRELHEVDHIIPLRGRYVSGLHVPNNLQILTKAENRRKSNAYDLMVGGAGFEPATPAM